MKRIIENNILTITSALIIISTTLIGTILHEFSHYIVAYYFGLEPKIYHNYVAYDSNETTELKKAIISGIGPLVSLISGVIFLLISVKMKQVNLVKLFNLWLGMNGILMFLGYLLISPLSKKGDTGKVFQFYELPNFIIISIAIVSFILIIQLFSKLSWQFRFYRSNKDFNQNKNAKQLFFFPVLISIVVITALNLPVVTWLSLLPTVCMPLTYITTYKNYLRMKIETPTFIIKKIPFTLIMLSIVLIVLFSLLKR